MNRVVRDSHDRKKSAKIWRCCQNLRIVILDPHPHIFFFKNFVLLLNKGWRWITLFTLCSQLVFCCNLGEIVKIFRELISWNSRGKSFPENVTTLFPRRAEYLLVFRIECRKLETRDNFPHLGVMEMKFQNRQFVFLLKQLAIGCPDDDDDDSGLAGWLVCV